MPQGDGLCGFKADARPRVSLSVCLLPAESGVKLAAMAPAPFLLPAMVVTD